MSKKTFALIIIIVLLALGGSYYWFFIRNVSPDINTETNGQENGSGIFGSGSSTGTGNNNQGQTGTQTTTGNNQQSNASIPVLRQLSTTPVGGVAASTTASSTIVRWIDRGVGRVYQAYSNTLAVDELSNTTIPRIYATYWNKNTTSFILQSIADDTDKISTFFATLFPVAAAAEDSSTASSTPFELRGSPLPASTLVVAVSPKGDKVFTLENGALTSKTGNTIDTNSIGYVSQFNGAKKTQIFSTPLSQVNIEWPEENTISVTTKGAANSSGFLYFINPKDGIFNKILSNVAGLSTLTSRDATRVLYTASTDSGIQTSIYDVAKHSSENMLFNTMPEKCVWGNVQKNVVYCAVPSSIPSATYPDDWYKGSVSFSDSIWEVDTATGDAHQIVNLVKVAGTVIDATNLTLDPQENYLYFVNKKNLTLWSLELNG